MCPENLVRSLTGTVLVWGCLGQGGGGWSGELGKTDGLYVLSTASGFGKRVQKT